MSDVHIPPFPSRFLEHNPKPTKGGAQQSQTHTVGQVPSCVIGSLNEGDGPPKITVPQTCSRSTNVCESESTKGLKHDAIRQESPRESKRSLGALYKVRTCSKMPYSCLSQDTTEISLHISMIPSSFTKLWLLVNAPFCIGPRPTQLGSSLGWAGQT